LEKAEVRLNVNYLDNRSVFSDMADTVVYTGMIDEYFDFCFGKLEYRSLKFEHEILDIPDYQGNAVVNYTDFETPYTRIIEHKHFEFGKQDQTVITREYPQQWDESKEAYYPVNDEKNNRLFEKYRQKAEKQPRVIFGGRLADYAYYDMDKTIRKALDITKIQL
jgi:UDP-galactopyranose mutase